MTKPRDEVVARALADAEFDGKYGGNPLFDQRREGYVNNSYQSWLETARAVLTELDGGDGT